MKISDIKYDKNENIIADYKNVKVEIKGIGPSIRVLNKCRIIVTGERLFIAQKLLFSAKHIVQYIIWLTDTDKEKLHFTKGITETGITEKGVKELDYKGNKITELSVNNNFIKYIRIFINRDNLFMLNK